jgi:aryl-alcohol dehydrogenase-like predicted oxidoreductase
MQYVEVAGVRVSKIGLGCWQFGSREWCYGRAYARDEAIRITNKALDLGINLIDTAEIYGFGQSERIVGRAIAGRRDEAFVATKIWPLMPVAPIVVDRGRRSARRMKRRPRRCIR